MRKIKLFYWILLVSIIAVIFYLKLTKIDFVYIYQENITEISKFSFVVILSILISLLFLCITNRKLDYWNLLIFPFLSIVVFLFNYIIISETDYKKFDYLFSEEIEKGKFEKYNDKGKDITQITFNNDTLFLHKYPIDVNQYTLKKSRLNKYYYLTKK